MSSNASVLSAPSMSQTALFLVKATPALSLLFITYCTLKGFAW